MFLGPWPYKEIWWCACVRNDCNSTLFGPFASLEEADEEAIDQKCLNPHISFRGEPNLNSNIDIQAPCFAMHYDRNAAWEWRVWFMQNRQRQPVYNMHDGTEEERCREIYESC